jgi:hypothetical protein
MDKTDSAKYKPYSTAGCLVQQTRCRLRRAGRNSLKNAHSLPTLVLLGNFGLRAASQDRLFAGRERFFYVCEVFNTPPIGAVKKVLNTGSDSLPEQQSRCLRRDC